MIGHRRGATPPSELVDVVVRRSDGNPLLVAALADVDAGADLFPAGIREMMHARLDVLGPDAARVVRAAAVLGPDLDEGRLAAVLDIDGAAVTTSVREPTERDILTVDGSGPDRRLAFRHELLREEALARSCRRASTPPCRDRPRRRRSAPALSPTAGGLFHRSRQLETLNRARSAAALAGASGNISSASHRGAGLEAARWGLGGAPMRSKRPASIAVDRPRGAWVRSTAHAEILAGRGRVGRGTAAGRQDGRPDRSGDALAPSGRLVRPGRSRRCGGRRERRVAHARCGW